MTMFKSRSIWGVVAAILVYSTMAQALAASTLQTVRERGYLKCGVTDRMQGFSTIGTSGEWAGFNVDNCRAIALAVLGSKDAIEFVPVWLEALQSGEVDVVNAGATWNLSRDASLGLNFTGTTFYDGQGFIAHASFAAKALGDVKKAKVCVVNTTATSGKNLLDFIATSGMALEPVLMKNLQSVYSAFVERRCDLATHDRTALAAWRAGSAQNPDDYVVFPDVISKEPLSPVVRDDDAQWFDIVRWVNIAMVAAEERGVTSANVDDMRTSTTPEIRRLLGVDTGLGAKLGLDDQWAYRIIKGVGNYGEAFKRSLGQGSPLQLQRGINDLWTRGGLLYAQPLR